MLFELFRIGIFFVDVFNYPQLIVILVLNIIYNLSKESIISNSKTIDYNK